jgi:hypothetical protein
VGRQAHQVDALAVHVERDLAGGLGRVHMEQHALAAAEPADGVDVLHHADLVVHGHHGDQDVRAHRRLQHRQVEQAVGLHRQVGDLEALALQFAHGVQHGLVLGLHRDQVLALGLVELGHALDGQVVGLGGAAGPDDLARVGPDQRGHMLRAISTASSAAQP